MSDRMVRVSVRILEKEYQVACLPEERSELLDSAEFLNGKMRDIRDAGNIVGLDRIAVMAALNLAHELLKRNRNDAIESEVSERVREMRERVESALSRGQQLPL
ncbi:cell division protein ZapA [Steroidobacter agaridevorans]|uniref:Cell division protein ZapA n=1 Tax=Steroidobacter agaridevorans TaxID=2695856 RepID=A0A829YII5_9GAMM|nr:MULTISPECIES: cell division protein ZapA [Steroidobacteraceae]GFE83117.1 cell division protein ZapA [Steroidobacter agaridevorans]GFE86199.1 cell division protein ZapA [Steroidobacter agaridevorans]